MKFSAHTHTAWWDLHAWAGLIVSLVAYVMFFFGTLTLFNAELRVWQEPRGPEPSLEQVDAIIAAGIAERQIDAKQLRLNFPRDQAPEFSLSYNDGRGKPHDVFVEARGLREPRSNVSDFFYGMHYLQCYGAPAWLYSVAGLVAGVLLLIVVTGILIHLRNVVRQFHQFRPKKRLQVVWSDAHKVLGTIGLPFALVYAFTGAWMGLDSILTSRLAITSFHGDQAAMSRALHGPEAPAPKPSAVKAERLPLADLLARARAASHGKVSTLGAPPDCRALFLNHSGDRDGFATFYCGGDSVVLRLRDGERLDTGSSPPTLSARIAELPYALHFVEFARWPLRALYAVLGVAGCLAILTGNWLWLERRVQSRGTRLVQRLTLSVGAGSLVASAGMLLASRFGISPAFERYVFWGGWLGVAAYCAFSRQSDRHWQLLLALAGAITSLAALLGYFSLGVESWPQPPVVRVVNAALLGVGLALLLVARSLRSRARKLTSSFVPEDLARSHVA